ncbi:MAG: flavin reductase family protein [Brevibacillus sp.]|nr:flavin reductase family protein [Brevibacillus sp.]
MYCKPEDLARKDVYKLLSGIVVPRPIAWISTLSGEGILNLAPFSFYTAISSDPPLVCVSIGSHKNRKKDTMVNIESTKEFVINSVSEELVEQMDQSAIEYEASVNEFEQVGLTPEPSIMVKVPRVKEAKISMECKLFECLALGVDFTLVIGQVVNFYIAEEVYLPNYKIDHAKVKAVGRMAGSYARTTDIFPVTRR